MSSSTDPVAALGDAWRRTRDAFRFSFVRGREVTSTHLLRIDNYSTVDSLLAHGKCVESRPFCAGGHQWKVCYYPNGHKDSTSSRPSVMLSLVENRRQFVDQTVDATATYDVSILDGGDGSLLYRHTDNGKPGGCRGIWADIAGDATAEEQKKALRLLKEDSLVVRCDVTVQSLQEESRAEWILRRFLQ